MSFNADAKKAGQRHKSSATSGALVPKAGAGDAVKANIKESTARALVLRNGKHGAMGAGELAAPARMSGREKLELLAEDKMKAMMTAALRAPFRLEKTKKIAEIRLDADIDVINRLHNNELVSEELSFFLEAMVSASENRKRANPVKNPEWVAQHFVTIIHNSYMLASGWKIVTELIKVMESTGLHDSHVREQLRQSEKIRRYYLLTVDLVKRLVQLSQHYLRIIASKTPYYAQFFSTSTESKDSDPQVKFDISQLRPVYKSFMDSIIVELCLPDSEFTVHALIACLHMVQEESPKETKRCPQAMWDAISALSDAVELLDQLETPLLALDDESWKKELPTPTKEITQWENAQATSLKVLQRSNQLSELVYPLSKLSDKDNLDKLWRSINSLCAKACGAQIDELWRVVNARQRTPIWYIPASALDFSDDEDGPGSGPPGLKSLTKHTGKNVTMHDADDDGYGSMPELLSASESEGTDEEMDEDTSDTDENEEADGEGDDESAYNTEDEEELRTFLKNGIDLMTSQPELFDGPGEVITDKYAEERKSNPFLKMLKSLKGRMFTSNPILKTDVIGPAGGAKPSTGAEEAAGDDEDRGETEKKKKKKKKPKKKKKKTTTTAQDDEGESDEEEEPEADPSPAVIEPPKSAAVAPKPLETAKPSSPTKMKAQPPKVKSPTATAPPFDPFGSKINLGSTQEKKAQSAHAYLQQTQGTTPKVKVKSRPEHPVEAAEQKKGLFSKFTGGAKTQEEEDSKPKASEIFKTLKKRSKVAMRRLFGVTAEEKKGGIKWQQFTQFMVDMGFSMTESVAGSRVTFTPNDKRLKSVTFHKPHPDSTLTRWKCRQYCDTLKKTYGWHVDKLKPILLDSEDELSD